MKKSKRIISLLLAATMAMSLAACGKQEEQKEVAEVQKEFVYVPEYIEMENAEESGMYNMQIAGNYMYYFQYSFDEATGTGGPKIFAYSLETGEVKEFPVTLKEQRNVNGYQVDSQGNLYTVENEWNTSEDMSSSTEKYFLCKYDAQGNSLLEQEITDKIVSDDGYGYVNSFVVDAQGRFYATADDKIHLFDAEGKYQGEILTEGNWIQNMGTGKDGKVYVTYYDSMSETRGYILAEVSFESRNLGQSYQNFPNSNGNGRLVTGIEGDFLVNDGSRVYEYDMETQAATELFNWLDSDINGSYVNYVGVLENGKVFAAINDWNTNKTELATLTKTSTAELPKKIQVTVGTLYDDQSLQAAAVSFNKKSDTYRINIKTYIDQNNWTETAWQDGVNRLNNDIISGSNCPDILDLSTLNITQLSAKGALEDLSPYMEKSTVISKDDFVESVVNAYTFDGKLVCVPSSFSMSTLVGKTADVGTEMGWTMEEMIAYAQEHPEAEIFDNASKTTMMYYFLSFNQDQFIDWTTGECKFESEEFKNLLNFISEFPDEIDWEEDDRSTPTKLQAGEVLLELADIYQLNSIQQYDAMFNEPVTFIGYPNANGDSGCYLTGSQMYAIASKSQNKDGAWAFIEAFLAEGTDMFSFGFPSKKADLEAMVAEETKVEYLTDENGNQILDEEGNPIILNSGGGFGYGDWEYTYHVVTQEEADRALELINVAQPAFAANQEILTIVQEEAEAFFQGQKSVDDVAGIIQNRVKVYVNENR